MKAYGQNLTLSAGKTQAWIGSIATYVRFHDLDGNLGEFRFPKGTS
jgi:hypothetical protein